MSIEPSSLLFQHHKKYQLPEACIPLPATVSTLVFTSGPLPPPLTEMLQRLTKACQLNEENSRLLTESFPLAAAPGLSRVLLFGGTEAYYPHLELNELKPAITGPISWLLCPKLEALNGNEKLKSATWQALKLFFQIP